MVAEGAFVGEAEALCGAAGGLVPGVAAPLPSAVAEGGHGVVGQEAEGLGGDAAAGNSWSPEDVADFGGAVGGDDVHQGLAAFDAVGGAVDDGEEHGVRGGGLGDEPGVAIGAGGEDDVGKEAVEVHCHWSEDCYVDRVAIKGGRAVTHNEATAGEVEQIPGAV